MKLQNVDADFERNRRLAELDRNRRLVVFNRNRRLAEFNRNQRPNIRNIQVDAVEEDEEVRESWNGTGKQNEQDKNVNTKHGEFFESLIDYINLVGRIFSFKLAYNWQWQKDILFLTNVMLLFFTWFSMLYTAYIHYRNNEYVKMLEPFSIVGPIVSVSNSIY